MSRIAGAFAALLVSLAGSSAQAQAPTSAPAASGERKNFLWEVSSLTNKVYLFGTIHAGKKDWFPLPEVVEKAFTESKVLVVEADITDQEAMMKSAPLLMYAPPSNLETAVGPEEYARFKKHLARYSLPEAPLRQLKPFSAVSMLVFSEWGRLGYLPNFGVDAYLIQKARAELKPLIEIEGVETQSALIGSLTPEQNRQIFTGTMKAIESGLTSEQITGMVNAWQSGDANLLLEIARKYNDDVPGAKEFEEMFIWARHDAMVKKIEGYLGEARKPHFIAVGALHMAGPRGLVELLRKRGFVVKQL
ncbi:TraB/GumN family protein [Usitatibacter palustris]|nr:TraB/GumN family protein [Usitatibacter palustris]